MDIDWKGLFTSTQGRIKRQTYWIGWAIQFAASLALGYGLGLVNFYASAIVGCLLLYPIYCIYAKRLQDMGKPGSIAAVPVLTALASQGLSVYMVAVLGIKPGFNPTAAQNMPPEQLGLVMGLGFGTLGLGLVGFVFWLVLGIAGGQEGPNRFGPEPGSDDEVFD